MSSLSSAPSSLFAINSSSFYSRSNFSKFQIVPSSSHIHFICRSQTLTSDLPFILHDALDASGIDTHHARVARENFCSQIEKLSEIERHTSISINRKVNLGKTALHIADEDDSLVSHSSVPLPIDSFLGRLDDLAMGFCRMYSSSMKSSPDVFLHNLERYLYVHKGFRRDPVKNLSESRALYLHSVLTHRSGSAAMLSLIYSEILKMLRLWSLLSFDAEIHFPLDLVSLPKGFDKLKSKVSDQQHILTSQSLLVEILRNLKQAFWPFQNDPTRSLFLRAASAAKCIDEPNVGEESGFERASAKAAQHRLERGVWTSVRLGDMRRALSACERLILLEHDIDELRDYSILLYHCGFYEESQRYLKFYQASRESIVQEETPNALRELENLAVEKLMVRLNLLSMDEGWTKPSINRSSLGKFSEPW